MSSLRKEIIRKAAEDLPQDKFLKDASKRQFYPEMTDTAKGKVRYIGGYIVAKLKHKTNLAVRNCAYKSGRNFVEQYENAKRTLHSFTSSETLVSDYPESLKETARKQNLSRGPTNINDHANKFFESLLNTLLNYFTGENFHKYGENLHKYVTDSVQGNKSLHDCFVQAIHSGATFEEVSLDFENPSQNIDCKVSACLHEITHNVDVIHNLFGNVISMASFVLFKQFSRDVITTLQIKKKMEHRKQVHVSASSHEKTAAQKKKSTPKISILTEEPLPSTSGMQDPVHSTSEQIVSSDEDDTFCSKCNKLYVAGNDWICCDSCNKWFDRKCAGLSNAFKWKKISKESVNFYCPNYQ
ncbi:hypothetical protein ACF0H5_005868 [Mactra antiquata]